MPVGYCALCVLVIVVVAVGNRERNMCKLLRGGEHLQS
jgi:hypothetical protein